MATTSTRKDVLFANATKTEIILLMREWFDSYGEIPREIDWDPSRARREGRFEIAAKFDKDGCWPRASTVKALFGGTWTNAVIEAGFYPRHRTKRWIETDVEERSHYLRAGIRALKSIEENVAAAKMEKAKPQTGRKGRSQAPGRPETNWEG